MSIEDVSLKSVFLGAIVGVLISAFLGPYIGSFATSTYVSMGAPGYETPELDVEMTEEEAIFHEGQNVSYYDGMEWEEEYTVYRVAATNEGKHTMNNIKVDIPLPGCSVYTNSEGETVSGNYDTTPIITTQVQTTADSGVQEKDCSIRISKDRLPPGNTITVEFVVTKEFDECDLLRAFSPRPEISAAYDWYVNSERYSEMQYTELNHLDTEYRNALYSFEKYTEGDASMELDRPYYLVLVGEKHDNVEEAIERNCM